LKSEAPSSLTITELQHTIRDAEGRIKDHLQMLSSNINSHTSTKVDEVQATQQSHHIHILHQLQLLSTVSKEYSNHMSGISTALLHGPLGSPSTWPPGLPIAESIDD
jgi:hypothetical protein